MTKVIAFLQSLGGIPCVGDREDNDSVVFRMPDCRMADRAWEEGVERFGDRYNFHESVDIVVAWKKGTAPRDYSYRD